MRKKFTGIALAALAVFAFGTPSASAATEFGDNCVANEITEGEPITFFPLTAAGNPLPLTAPSGGVVTKWKATSAVPASIPQTLKVLRQNGPSTVQLIGEAPGSISPGSNTFDARVPVQTGDRLGLFGPSAFGNIFCVVPGPTNLIGGFLGGGGGVGSTNPFVEITSEARFPVAAVIEPDVDNDGFGDETQDKCPQLASAQTECPVVTVNGSSVIKRKGSVIVLLTTSSAAPVKVKGTVNLGKGNKAKLGSKVQTVAPGKVARFTLKFPKKLKKRLEELTPKQSLRLNIAASATDLIGRVTTDKLKVRLKGQGESKNG